MEKVTRLAATKPIVLSHCLTFVGLLPNSLAETTNWRQIAKISLLFILSFIALAFEIMAKIAKLIELPNGDVQVFDVVQYSQYWVKTVVVIMIFVLVVRKSRTMLRLMEQLDSFMDEHSEQGKSDRWWWPLSNQTTITASVTVAFSLYVLTMTATRVRTVIRHYEDGGPAVPFLGWEMHKALSEVIMLVGRNYTEPIRVMCAGYLGILLCRFAEGLAVKCENVFAKIASGSRITLTSEDVQEAWNAREMALTMSELISDNLGSLLSAIIISDVLCLNSSFANFLFPCTIYTVFDQIRNGVQIVVYITSLLSITTGLIRLHDIDDRTWNIVKKLQSGNTHCLMFARNSGLGTGKVLQTWRSFKAAQGCEIAEEVDLVLPLYILDSSCFGHRKVAPVIAFFGHVTRGTIISAFGLLLTFFCFMMDQLGRSQNRGAATATLSLNSSQSLWD
ncbi:hypothetical protein BV898_06298 [Hypsibius exemplaris]|uniref:Gustatory receptor n=1 Tax=Hypsibius exemplaris TaxID=2072580 RepID=A0A1W0WX33_HYPEX|nr:hypothetical protein BV898_06298 [Hypsibius exemplaris]